MLDLKNFEYLASNFHYPPFPHWVNYLKFAAFILLTWWLVLLVALILRARDNIPPWEKLEKWQSDLSRKRYPDKVSRLWREVEDRLSSKNEFDWQVALNKINQEFLEVLKKLKLPGKNIEEKILHLDYFHFSKTQDLLKSYQFLIKLSLYPKKEIKLKEAKKIVNGYYNFFHWLLLI